MKLNSVTENKNIYIRDLFERKQLTLLHSEWPKLHRVLAVLSAIGLSCTVVDALLLKRLVNRFDLSFQNFGKLSANKRA